MRRLNLEVRTWLYLARAIHKIERRLLIQINRHDLTAAQFDVLAQLQNMPPMLQKQLAERLLVTKGNVVGLLNRMEEAGLVCRHPHPDDGRAHLVSLTPQGVALADRVVPEHETLVTEYLGVLTPEERHTLHVLVRRLDRAFGVE